MGDRTAEDETARLDAGDLVDLGAGPGIDQLIDRAAEGAGVAEQRRDVAKQDARLRVIRNGANGGLQIVFKTSSVFSSLSLRHSGARERANPEFVPTISGSGFARFTRAPE